MLNSEYTAAKKKELESCPREEIGGDQLLFKAVTIQVLVYRHQIKRIRETNKKTNSSPIKQTNKQTIHQERKKNVPPPPK
jgi:hypothetical protein